MPRGSRRWALPSILNPFLLPFPPRTATAVRTGMNSTPGTCLVPGTWYVISVCSMHTADCSKSLFSGYFHPTSAHPVSVLTLNPKEIPATRVQSTVTDITPASLIPVHIRKTGTWYSVRTYILRSMYICTGTIQVPYRYHVSCIIPSIALVFNTAEATVAHDEAAGWLHTYCSSEH